MNSSMRDSVSIGMGTRTSHTTKCGGYDSLSFFGHGHCDNGK